MKIFSSADRELISKLDFKKPYIWVATGLGSGFMRPAPGTWGSLITLPISVLIYESFGIIVFCGFICFVLIAGFWASSEFTKATQTDDHSMIVIDEVAGQAITLIAAFHFWGQNFFYVALSFLLFRLFDILKPWPVSYFDRNVKGAAGIMLDDIAAGLMAGACLTGLYYAGFSAKPF